MDDEIPKKHRPTTTARLAPVFIPSIDGSAIGFLLIDCIRDPLTARDEPANKASIVLGILFLMTDTPKSSAL